MCAAREFGVTTVTTAGMPPVCTRSESQDIAQFVHRPFMKTACTIVIRKCQIRHLRAGGCSDLIPPYSSLFARMRLIRSDLIVGRATRHWHHGSVLDVAETPARLSSRERPRPHTHGECATSFAYVMFLRGD